jgi:hypothetical protein
VSGHRSLEFPSLDWFRALQELANGDPEFRRLGNVDATVGVRVADDLFLLAFEGFRCESVRRGAPDEEAQADFVLAMSPALWREMIESIAANGAADRPHTLNTLDLLTEGGIARSPVGDQYRADLFFRYNQSLQHFFDLSARLATGFRDGS